MAVHINNRSIQVYVKEDDLWQMGVRKLLKDNLQPSHLWRSWQRARQLQAAGIPVQQPVAMLKYRRWGIVRKTVYVGEYLPDMAPLSSILSHAKNADAPNHKAELLATLASELRTMHDRGFYHRDLKSDNILAQHHTDRWTIVFIDLEGVIFKKRLIIGERAVDLGRLWLALLPLTAPTERERFLDHYAAVPPPLDQTLLRRLIERRVVCLRTRRFGRLPEIGNRIKCLSAESSKSELLRRWIIIALHQPHDAEDMLPLLSALYGAFPTVRFVLVITDDAGSLLSQAPNVDTIIIMRGRHSKSRFNDESVLSLAQTIRLMRADRYEVSIDLTDSAVSAFLTRLSGASIRVGYRSSSIISKWIKRAVCYTQMIRANRTQRDPVRHYLLVAEALGVNRTRDETVMSAGVRSE